MIIERRFPGRPVLIVAGLLLALAAAGASCAAIPDAQRVAGPAPTVASSTDQATDRSSDRSATDPSGDRTGRSSNASQAATDTFGAGCKPDIVAEICVDVALAGAQSVTGDGFVTAPQPPGSAPDTTCAAIAADAEGGNLGDQLAHLDGHTVAWDATLTDYHGPGIYHPGELHLTIDDHAYSTSGRGRASVAIGPTFATVITLTDLESADERGATVSGRIVWTCLDPASAPG